MGIRSAVIRQLAGLTHCACNNGSGGILHTPLARTLHHLDRYCIIVVHTLNMYARLSVL